MGVRVPPQVPYLGGIIMKRTLEERLLDYKDAAGVCCGQKRIWDCDKTKSTGYSMCHAKCTVCEKVAYLPIIKGEKT